MRGRTCTSPPSTNCPGTAPDLERAPSTPHPGQTASAAGNTRRCSEPAATEQRGSFAVRILLRRTSRSCGPDSSDLHPETQRLTQGSPLPASLFPPPALTQSEPHDPLTQLGEADSH